MVGFGGSQSNPFVVEEEFNISKQRSTLLSNGGSKSPIIVEAHQYDCSGDPNHPILLEDYEDDDLTLQFAIRYAASSYHDPKGKKAIQSMGTPRFHIGESFRNPTVDAIKYAISSGFHIGNGESSSSRRRRTRNLLVNCGICMESKLLSDIFEIPNCSHSYCNDCIASYVAAKVGDNATAIGCPDPDCKDGFLDPEVCGGILPPEVLDRWGISLCEATIPAEMKFYCPYKECSALLIKEEDEEAIAEAECPHCRRLFCAECRVRWHAGVSCVEYQRLHKDERSPEDLLLMKLAQEKKYQRCPKCRVFVEKIHGCEFIICRCGFRFCYGCAKEMKEQHYCKDCGGLGLNR